MNEEVLLAAAKQTGLGLRSNRPRVYLVSDVGDGTSGMLLDVAYEARHLLRQKGYVQPDVLGLLLLPAVESAGEKARATANTFAALAELNYFSAPGTVFSATYLDQCSALVDPAAPFSRCFLLPVPRGQEHASRQELAIRTGEFLARELATPLARVTDEARSRRQPGRLPAGGAAQAASAALPRTSPPGLVCHTFGAYWFAVPRRLLLQRVARCLCHRLVQGWRSDSPENQEKKVRAWIAQQLANCQLTPEALATQVEEEAARSLQQTPEEAVKAILAPYQKEAPKDLGGNPTLAAEAVAAVEQLVGSPAGDVATSPAPLAESLRQAASALAGPLEEHLAEMALQGLAEPQFRLLGVEDLVQSRLSATLAELGRACQTEADKLAKKAATQHAQIPPLLETLCRGSFWGWGKKDRLAGEVLDLLCSYAMLRRQVMTGQVRALLYQDLHANLQKYLRKVGCCRARIAQFLQGLEAPAEATANVDLGLGQYLLPAGCRTLPDAVAQILSCLAPEELEEIHSRVLGLIGRAFEAHVHVCTAPGDFFKGLEEAVMREVAAVAEAPLGRAHAAEMYVAQRAQDDRAVDELAGAFDEAVPELAGARSAPEDELKILAVPPGAEGEHFRALVQQALPDQDLVPAASADDIVFYREVLHLSLASVPQMSQAAADVHRQFLTDDPLTPHSRTDITDWRPGGS